MKLLHANDALAEHAPSWYRASCTSEVRAALEQDVTADVCIIGAGYTGLAAALELAGTGHRTVVLDAHRAGWGASGRNGGQLGSGFNKDQRTLQRMVGKPAAHALWQIAEEAKQHIRQLCRHHCIDIEETPGIIYAQHRQRHVSGAHDYCSLLAREYGYDQMEALSRERIRELVSSDNYHGGVLDHGAAHVHPLKLAQGLASAAEKAGAIIHESSEVLRIEPDRGGASRRVITAKGSVRCGKVILAANGYLDELQPSLNKWSMPINNFIVVTEKLGDKGRELLPLDHAVADSRFVVNYYRRVDDDRLLFGGGETYTYRFPSDIVKTVRPALSKVFPQLKNVAIDHAWGGTLAITRNRLPFLRQIDDDTYAAGGYSGHGLALAPMYGTAIAEHINGQPERFDCLSALPLRGFPGGAVSRPALLAVAMTAYSWLDRL